MILIFLSLVLIGYFIFDQKNFIYALMVFYLVFDMFDGFYKDLKVFAGIRYVLPLIMVMAYIIANKAFKKGDWIFLILTVYIIGLLMFNPGNFMLSAKTAFALIISLSMVLVGNFFGSKRDFIKEFEPYNRFMLIAIPLYLIMANVLHIGEAVYGGSFTTGFLGTSRMYIAPIVIFISIHYVLESKKSSMFLRIIDISFITLNIIFLVVITRRTSVGMLAFAIIAYAVLNRKIVFKLAMVVVSFLAIMVLTYPLYQEQLNAQLAERERITEVDNYSETEPRYMETIFLYQHFKNSEDPSELLFGIQLFDTIDFGIKNFGYGRSIHSDINMLIYSTGLFGMLLFLIFFIHYFMIGNNKMNKENQRIFYPLLVMLLIVLVPGRFIGTFTFAPLIIFLLCAVKASRPKKIKRSIPVKNTLVNRPPKYPLRPINV
ncbi:hypothetical protein DN752_21570 [Echinicola strongylocentroti]|uniref:O-antigen ligase domain-containing protein n=1 Tax=Echinicola strongylocentroti TaxID=1795355 RepID=A0A2Z4IP47_9BACT|nr:hypothetical protein [Echinicola strongylocentroti]AWW32529.1 hypothetical protein DN752_21570 [Echinicola strongylocentroti]